MEKLNNIIEEIKKIKEIKNIHLIYLIYINIFKFKILIKNKERVQKKKKIIN